MVLADTTYGIVFPITMAARHDSILVLGVGGRLGATGQHVHGEGDDSATVGFLLTNGRRTVTAIPAPHGMPTARYFRVRDSADGWDAAFFVPDRDTTQGTRYYDDGTLWYGHLRAGRWSDVERIGHVEKTVVMLPNSTGLARSGPPSFAVYYGELTKPGGIVVWQRSRPGVWRADTIGVPFSPVTIRALSSTSPSARGRFFFGASVPDAVSFLASGLAALGAESSQRPNVLRRAPDSMNNPVLYSVNDTLRVSWWQFEGQEPPTLWYQVLRAGGESPAAERQRVARGINDFIFLAVPEGAGTRLVWAYRPPHMTDSAEVAVVANGEPKVVGRVAFPFGFMTNGVASGDRSFILATTPRPVPDEEPSASRTLEVRVDCHEGT